MDSWDTGISSETIWSVMRNRAVRHYGTPKDPQDLGRCLRLLDVAPGWRERLGEVAMRFPEWKPLVDNWTLLETLYRAEAPTGYAPRCAALMRKLRGE